MRLRFERVPHTDLKAMHPAYFALAMATGIVAITTQLHGVPVLPVVLFWLNAGLLVAIAAATVLRIGRHHEAFLADVRSHSRAVGFFTLVAAVGVFGDQLILQMGATGLARVFWAATAALWLVVTYGLLTVLTVKREKPPLAEGLNGGWLVSVVATQSLAILTVLVLRDGFPAELHTPLMFMALVLWLGAWVLYLWLMTLIFFRYTFLPMLPQDLTPPYWINMGAVAISTLAGTVLLRHAELAPIVEELAPFIKGLTLLFWSVGSWWIPMLLVLGVWRHLLRGVPVAYDPLYWGGVFPLGMYSVCTYRLAEVVQVPFLLSISGAFAFIAMAAWTVAFAGLIDSLVARVARAQTRTERTQP